MPLGSVESSDRLAWAKRRCWLANAVLIHLPLPAVAQKIASGPRIFIVSASA